MIWRSAVKCLLEMDEKAGRWEETSQSIIHNLSALGIVSTGAFNWLNSMVYATPAFGVYFLSNQIGSGRASRSRSRRSLFVLI